MKLKASIRKKEDKLDNKQVPAVLYGPGVENKILTLNNVELEKAYEEAGESNLIDLEIDGGETVKVIIKDVQKHFVKGTIIHVDFYQVDMNKKITAEIPLNFINTAKAEKEQGALIMKNLDSVEVECLPTALVNNIDIDLSVLESIGDSVNVSDIKVPEGMEIMNDETEVVVSAIEPKQEEEVKEEVVEEESGEDKKEEEKGENKEENKEE
ncbi:50S ribosomal protein L25 [bacterium]|nr:50S ribosomal protein L25 [bacterium]